jgi:hypothetical protein
VEGVRFDGQSLAASAYVQQLLCGPAAVSCVLLHGQVLPFFETHRARERHFTEHRDWHTRMHALPLGRLRRSAQGILVYLPVKLAHGQRSFPKGRAVDVAFGHRRGDLGVGNVASVRTSVTAVLGGVPRLDVEVVVDQIGERAFGGVILKVLIARDAYQVVRVYRFRLRVVFGTLEQLLI